MTGVPRIAAVVVAYHPPHDLANAVASYAEQVEVVLVADNSDPADYDLPARLQGVTATFLPRLGNVGVARALNIAAEQAIAEGFDFLLTMDQDSIASPGMVATMLECLDHSADRKIGIISPFHVTKSSGKPPADVVCQEVMTPMTSGCLLNLAVFRSVGPFREDFFIDFVDNEYCLRLRSRGYGVVRANRALLRHEVGDTRKYGPFVATNHSPVRRYYKTRNRLQVFDEYVRIFPAHCLFDMVRLVKEIGSIVLFEGEKRRKLQMMWRGYLDYRRGQFGPLEECR